LGQFAERAEAAAAEFLVDVEGVAAVDALVHGW